MRGPRHWIERRRRRAFDHRLLAVDVVHVEPATGKPEADPTREVISLATPDWVNVVALTSDRDAQEEVRVVLVRQWRFAVGEPTLEIPGGMVDPGESPLEAARRELLEETGFVSDDWRALGSVHPNPAILENRCHTFLATSAAQQGPPGGDGDEEIEVTALPLRAIPGAISAGEITHSLVIAAFHLLSLDSSSSPDRRPPR